ncbi:MAG: acyl-CoA dehydrogenase family protein [Pseudonocardiaceae bacterium]
MTSAAITGWLHPMQPVLDPAHVLDWPRLHALDAELDAALRDHPVGPGLAAGLERSRRLLAIRTHLAQHQHLYLTDQPRLFQLIVQFLCGYRDLDLRDATGVGHGQLIARHGAPATRERWVPRLLAGELAGIAITEPHGGSRPAATRTRAVLGPAKTWLVSGRKTWISRLTEASVFVVFFRDPTGQLAAAAIDATTAGLHRTPLPPSGLSGWEWGILDLHEVVVRPEGVLAGDGMLLLREHFAHYRPLVTATALGGAAMIFDSVTTTLGHRHAAGDLPRVRDSALITIGRTHAQLTTALFGAAVASCLAAAGDHQAELWGAATKAHGVDVANQAAAELALLVGAAGFRADSPIAKTRRDLSGFLLADGVHDSLLRAAGLRHVLPAGSDVPTPRSGPEQVPPPAPPEYQP